MRERQFLIREHYILFLSGLIGAAIGWLSQNTVEQAMSGKSAWLALAALVVPVLLLMALRPVFGAVAVIGFGFVNPSLLPPLTEIGELSIRYGDLVFGLLMGLVLVRMAVRNSIKFSTDFRELSRPLLFFLLYVGISLVIVRLSTPEFFGVAVASYLRLVITAMFAVLLHLVLQDEWDMHVFHTGLIFFAIASVGVGAYLARSGLQTGGADVVTGRFAGVLSTGSFGLVAGLLVLYAFINRDHRPRSVQWMVPLVVGLVGLFLAKSAISIFATAGTVTLYLAVMRSPRGSVHGLLKAAAVGSILMACAVLAVWIFRQGEMVGLLNLSSGSFADRAMIGYAGLRIFLDNVLIGVGWQASAADGVIGSHALKSILMERFPDLPVQYFRRPPTSVHNMYIQFLAEFGLVGFALIAWAWLRAAKIVVRIVKSVPAGSPYRTWVQFYALALMFLLIWWNGNPLFGGQTETILAWTFLALLASVAQFERQRARQNLFIHNRYGDSLDT